MSDNVEAVEKSKKVPLRELAVSRGETLRFTSDQLLPMPGFNVRSWHTKANVARVKALAESILLKGVMTPIEVIRPEGSDNLYIKAGETRWRAVRLLEEEGRVEPGLIKFNAVVVKEESELDSLASLVASNDHQVFSALDFVEIFKRYDRYGCTQVEIAQRLGKPLHFVTSIWPLTLAGQELRQWIEDEVISHSTVVLAIREHGATGAINVISEAIETQRANRLSQLEEIEETISQLEEKVHETGNRRRGRRNSLTPAERELRTAQKMRDAAAKKSGNDRITAAVVVPKSTNWQNDPKVTQLLVAIRYVASWTEEQETFHQLNQVLQQVGLDPVESRKGLCEAA